MMNDRTQARTVVTNSDEGPTIVGVFVAANAEANLDPRRMVDGAKSASDALAAFTPDEQMQILSFMLMAACRIDFQRAN